MSELRRRCLRLDPSCIVILRSLLEGYDNMALVTTLDARAGRVMIRYVPDFESRLNDIITTLHTTEPTS